MTVGNLYVKIQVSFRKEIVYALFKAMTSFFDLLLTFSSISLSKLKRLTLSCDMCMVIVTLHVF